MWPRGEGAPAGSMDVAPFPMSLDDSSYFYVLRNLKPGGLRSGQVQSSTAVTGVIGPVRRLTGLSMGCSSAACAEEHQMRTARQARL